MQRRTESGLQARPLFFTEIRVSVEVVECAEWKFYQTTQRDLTVWKAAA